MNLKELSDFLKLSPTTVSRAINGYPEVSEATRKRVVEAAEANNYHPSHLASGLAKGKAMAIGHVIPLSKHMVMNPHFSDFISGAGDVYCKAGYDMLIRVVAEGEEESVYKKLAKDGRVDGVIVHGPSNYDARIEALQDIGIPFVVHGRTNQDESTYNWVDVNNVRAFKRATNYLLDLGHRDIAFINGFEFMNFAMRRRSGYEEALHEASIEINPEIMFTGEMTEPQGYESMKQLLKRAKPPTAILLSSILPSMGAMRAVQEAGLTVGKDVSIVTFDDQLSFLQNSGDIPMFTSVRSSIRDAGVRVAEILLDQINQPKADPYHELWEAELVLGKSTGRPVSV
ncbi:LacI family DNA-binding transcriptional regulator [Leucothrix arctica]|uniref:LacI family transcriptional regulator n=1 Tax=Leucothrix arctica TaxID=1481894 RepID=A0A317C5F6_9GAMM|nr:substrate-binding domain-containing protein [Leucothrix arctica]PWQ93451.1 LacI family transcriptional regulator [Leucothrix arctica]